MSKSKVVYGIWTAYVDQTGLVKTAAWGSEPWVTQELCGKKGVVDLLWKTKATHFLGVPESGVDVYEPVTGTLHKYGLAHLTDVFTKNRVDAAAFTRLTEDQVRVYFFVILVDVGDEIDEECFVYSWNDWESPLLAIGLSCWRRRKG